MRVKRWVPSDCWVPFCRWDRKWYREGRRAWRHLEFLPGEAGFCGGEFRWRHRGRHLICDRCGADGT